MKAGVKLGEGSGNFAVKQIDPPSPGQGEALVQVKASGVCGADVLLYEWTYRGRFPVQTPLVLGHEGAGVVVETGGDAGGFKPGDRVTMESIVGCGGCYHCRGGMPNLCPQWRHLGITFDGTFAEYVRVPASALHHLPPNVSFEDAALVEPLSIAAHTFERLRMFLGDSVVIVGPGTLGLLLTQAARSHGASKVIVAGLGKDKLRMEKAAELGADAVVTTDEEDAVKRVQDLTGGIGADVVIEAAGTPESFKMALKMVRGAGRVAVLGYSNHGEVEPILLARQEVTILGVIASVPRHFEHALRWLGSNKVSTQAIISHRLGLDEAEQGIRLMRDKEATKVCLTL